MNKKISILNNAGCILTIEVPTEAVFTLLQSYFANFYNLTATNHGSTLDLNITLLACWIDDGINMTILVIPARVDQNAKVVSFLRNFVGWELPCSDYGVFHSKSGCGGRMVNEVCTRCGEDHPADSRLGHICPKCAVALRQDFTCPMCYDRFQPNISSPRDPNTHWGQLAPYDGKCTVGTTGNQEILSEGRTLIQSTHKPMPSGIRL